MEAFTSVADARLLLAVVAVAGAGFLRGFVGFGSALMTVPVFAFLYGPLAAVPMTAILGVASTLALLPIAIRESEREVVVPIGLSVFFAAPFGTWILVTIEPALMRIIISILVVIMVAALARGWRLEGRVHRGVLIGAGLAGGLVQGSAGIGGPPVVAVALSRPGSSASQRANVIGVMTAIAMSGMLPLAWYGLFTMEVVVVGALLTPVNYAATAFGSRYFRLGGERYFRSAALGVLALIGAATLVAAAHDAYF
jgi:uncharacterized protein